MLALKSKTATTSPDVEPKLRKEGSASAAIMATAARICRIKRRLLRRSQPSRVPSGRSLRIRSHRNIVVVPIFRPLGLRLCKNRMSGIAPASNNNAYGRCHNMTQATLLT